jgi:hypothetical protein
LLKDGAKLYKKRFIPKKLFLLTLFFIGLQLFFKHMKKYNVIEGVLVSK